MALQQLKGSGGPTTPPPPPDNTSIKSGKMSQPGHGLKVGDPVYKLGLHGNWRTKLPEIQRMV